WRRLLDLGHGEGCLFGRDGDTHDAAIRVLEARDLVESRFDITCVGLGHRLHDDLGGTADDDVADANGNRLTAWFHGFISTNRYMSPGRSNQTKEQDRRNGPPVPERDRPAGRGSIPAPGRRSDHNPGRGTARCSPTPG